MKFLRLLLFVCVLAACAPAATPTGDESKQINALVQSFGQKLQLVSLLSPTAPDDIRAQYADYVSPDLLEKWAADPSRAPGKLTSSPWPDHIEISSVQKKSASEFLIKGEIIELTSVEVEAGSGAAAKIPVEITVQKDDQGKWLISGFKQS